MDETREEISAQMQRALDRGVRVLGFIPDADSEEDDEVGSILRDSKVICLNVPDAELAAETETPVSKAKCRIGHTLAGSDASMGSGERYPR